MPWAHRDGVGSQGQLWAHRDGGLSGFGERGTGTEGGKGEHPRLKSTEAGCFVWWCFESSFRPTKSNKLLRKSGDLDGKYLMVVRLLFRGLGLQHLCCCSRFLFGSFQAES